MKENTRASGEKNTTLATSEPGIALKLQCQPLFPINLTTASALDRWITSH